MLAALVFSIAVASAPQSLAELEDIGACYSAALSSRDIIQADNEAGYSEPDDAEMIDILTEIETAAGARIDSMKAFTDTLSDEDLIAVDDRITARLNGFDEAGFGAFLDHCVTTLGIDAA